MPLSTRQSDSSYNRLLIEDDDEQTHYSHNGKDKTLRRLLISLILICSIILVILYFMVYHLNQAKSFVCSNDSEAAEVSPPRSGYGMRRYEYFEEGYDDEDFAKGDPFWASDFPKGDGVIFLNQEQMKSFGLYSSVISPFRDGNVSAFESAAYHSMHCLSSLRYHLWMYKIQDPSQPHITSKHSWLHIRHCLADLRQYILCNYDENLLHVMKQGWHPGGGQPKRCKTLDLINQWLEEHYIPLNSPSS